MIGFRAYNVSIPHPPSIKCLHFLYHYLKVPFLYPPHFPIGVSSAEFNFHNLHLFLATPGSAQGFVLVHCSEITPGRTRATLQSSGDQS